MKHAQSLKRVLSFLMALAMILTLLPTAVFAATNYYVAGEPASVFGNTWNEKDPKNIMVPNKYTDTHLYYKIYDNVTSGTIKFKVTDGTWDNAWPGADVSLNVPSAKNIVVIRFDSNNKAVMQTAVSHFSIAGDEAFFGENWNPASTTNTLEYNPTSKLYEKTFENVSAGTYSFKVAAGSWDFNWGGSGSGGNYTFTVGEDKAGGSVTITFEPSTLTVNAVVTAPAPVPETYDVTFVCTNVSYNGAGTATEGEVYTATLTADQGYTLPETIEVKVGEATLTADTGYTYEDGKLTINAAAITGNITVTAAGVKEVVEPEPETYTVYCINSMGWDALAAHAWPNAGTGTTWPGKVMTKTEDTVNGFDVYSVTFDVAYDNVIFNNNNNGSQSLDLTFMAGQYYDVKTDTWYESLEDVPAVDPLSTDCYLVGSFNGWSTVANEFKLAKEGDTVGSLTLTLDEGTYEFKVVVNGTWHGNDGTINDTTNGNGWKMESSDNTNCTLEASGGEYTFLFDTTANKLTVNYVPASGGEDPDPTPDPDPEPADYYLIGYINGVDHGDGDDYANLGDYPFVNGTVTATFETDSYVCVKTGDNTTWYMTDGWQGKVSSATLYDSSTLGETADKLFVPSGVEVTFTLVVNDDGTLTLSYTTGENTNPEHDYYLIGYIEGANYSGTEYGFDEEGKLTAEFGTDSYVAVKSGKDSTEYLTNGWLGAVTEATLYNKASLSSTDKLIVPGGVEVTFTLAKNEDGTLTLSYEAENAFTEDKSGIQDGVTLHAWNWSFDNITANLELIKELGYTAVQTSPIQPLKEDTSGVLADHWWVYYQPVDFVITTADGNALGTKEDFVEMCEAAEELGIKIIVDVVANHLANNKGNDLSPVIPDKIRTNTDYWHDISVDISQKDYEDGNRAGITQKCMGGLPDLNTANQEIQDMVIAFLEECIDAGADGFRFDAAKHIEAPKEDESFASDFWSDVIGAVNDYAEDIYVYGEFLDDAKGTSIAYYTEYMSVTDNSWGNCLRDDVVAGKTDVWNRGYYKVAPASKLVLWAESHDTYGNENGTSTGISEANINKTWALVAARKDAMGLYFARPESLATTKLGEADVTGWANEEVKAVNNFHNAFVDEEEVVGSSGKIAYVVRGDSGAVLVNLGTSNDVSLKLPLADGTYYDQITGWTFTVEDGTVSGKIGSTGIAVLTTDEVENPEPETITVYFNPGPEWPSDNAWFAAHYWGDGLEGQWIKMAATDEAGVYQCKIDSNATGILFTRNDPAETDPSWDTKWNQTVDLTIPNDGKNYFTITNSWGGPEGKAEGTWSVYTPNAGGEDPDPTVTYSITGSFTSPSWNPANGDVMTDEDKDGIYEYTYNYVPSGLNSFKVTTGSWAESWGGNGADGNYEFTLNGPSRVTIKFNADTKEITHTAESIVIEEPISDVTIHFRNVDGWSAVNAYVWDLKSGSELNSAWPGKALTENEDHANWYTVEITGKNCPDGIGFIFNNGSSQTGNVYIIKNGEYWYDGELLTEAPESWDDGSVTLVPYEATFHFINSLEWETVNLYAWLDGAGELTGTWPGSAVKVDDAGYYTVTVTFQAAQAQDLNFIFNNGSSQTADLVLPAGEFVLDEADETYKAEKYVALTSQESGKYNAVLVDDPASIVNSPVVSGNSVTFNYGNKNATSVSVAGSFNKDWTPTVAMDKDEETGVWSVTIDDLESGDYQYKFIVDGDWIPDPMNSNTVTTSDGTTNSAFFILSGDDVEDDDTVTIRVHYTREDGNYDGWNLWVWGSNMGGHQVDFKDVGGEKVATIVVENARTHMNVGFKERLSVEGNEWKDQAENDRIVDLSTIVSGTIDYYIPECRAEYTDIIRKNKVTSVALDYDNNAVTVSMVQALANPKDSLKLVKGEETVAVSISNPTGSNYVLALGKDNPIDLAELHLYTLYVNDKPYEISVSAAYASDKFADEFTYDGDLGALYTAESTTFRVWAPTATAVALNLYATGSADELGNIKLGQYAMEQIENGVWEITVKGDQKNVYYTYSVTRAGETVEAVDPYARATGVNGERGMVIDLDSTDPNGWSADNNPNTSTSYTDAIIYELHVRDFSIDESSGVSAANRGKYLAFTEDGTTYKGHATGIDYLDALGITHLHLLPVYDYGSVDETKCENFNWGYDPVNYNVPEGSYSTNPYDGAVRVGEFKQMVQSLHDHDISVIMDVVYNHVYDADAFCFNQIVPGYFSRVNSNISGCGNDTASEREMVRKYIVESVLYWHQEYHIDGFRFDLVGLLDVDTINEIVKTVHDCCPEVIFYGEGWYMDGTNKEPGTEMAKQDNAYKTPGFAYFSDSMRNLVAGDARYPGLGYVSGASGLEGDIITNFLANPSWTTNPSQVVQYASCHDNYTLVDRIIVATGKSGLDNETIKMSNLAATIYMTAQGIPFIHAGEELLREKVTETGEREHNSYNSSDFVNHIQWYDLDNETYQNNVEYYKGLIEFRKDHSALRLDTAAKVESYVKSEQAGTNLLKFTFDAKAAGDIAESIIVIFNANKSAKTVTLPAGTWNICVNAENAGTKVLDTVSGSVSVEGISAMILVKGETCDHEWVWEDCDNEAVCDKCGETGETGKHSFTGKASNKKATDATCEKAATYYVQCDNCDEVSDTVTVPVGDPAPHVFGTKASSKKATDATCEKAATYYVQCDNCDAVSEDKTVSKGEKADHKFAGGKCSVCGTADPDYVKPTDPTEPDPTEPDATEPDETKDEIVRVFGENRFETAFKVANELKAEMGVEKFDSIIIASGADFADALAGSYLATVKNAPILLSYKAEQNLQVVNYIRQNVKSNGTVYILGGNKAVPAAMDTLLVGYQVKRLAGENRFETNLAILKEAGVKEGQNILVCTATNFADSLSASATGMPILLVYNEKGKLTDSQKAYLGTLKNCSFTVIGGKSAVGDALENAVKAYGTTKRLEGANRFETSVKVAETFFTAPKTAVLAYAKNYPDGLCGGMLAYVKKAPLILTMTGFETAAKAYMAKAGIDTGVILGGESLIADNSAITIFDANGATITVK